jgi:glycosyltransferase A (GT-A) superfamily protein (DUF2064 family)
MSADLTLLVMAKAPVPGRVKTRLTPPFSPTEAAALAEAALRDTLDVVLAAPAGRRVVVLDGVAGNWVPPGVEVVPQVDGDLDARIAGALAGVDGPVLLIGMDTPQLTVGHLSVSFARHDAWFGPSEDGGFWALGLARPDPTLVLGVPMSRSCTGTVQLGRLIEADLRIGLLPLLRDVDTAECAEVVSALAPHARFAAQHARFTAAPAGPARR